jgi:hypothetical protein
LEAGKSANTRHPKKIRSYTDLRKFSRQRISANSHFRWKKKSILYVLNADVLGTENHPYHIKTKGVTRTLKARHPDFGRPAELALLSPVDGAHGTAEMVRRAGLNLDERHGSAGPLALCSGCNQIDVAATIPKAPLGNLPTVNRKPSLRDSLAFASHDLPRC